MLKLEYALTNIINKQIREVRGSARIPSIRTAHGLYHR